jgi:Glycosyl hydrolase family 79, N-terminal domain
VTRVRDFGRTIRWCYSCAAIIWSLVLACSSSAADILLAPANMPRIGSVDERFQSYNIEMVEVTGGSFWKPYGSSGAGDHSGLFSERKPKDLGNERLRTLAAALSPAFMRVSGTWANTTYFTEPDDASTPPAGFKAVLTGRQWQGVIDFSRVVDAPIATSFAISAGTRDAAGIWTPERARRVLAASRSIGGRIAAVELMNEPDLPAIGGAPDGYDAAAYGRDFAVFGAFMKQEATDVMILGPGTIGASDAADLFAASAQGIDAVSYHYYGAVSARCGGQQTPEAALSEAWLSRTDQTLTTYRALRDRLAPGRPIWLTETAETACGGNPWSATFLDTFRYLDQLGRLARAGVEVVMHNTLAASDYGLLDEQTFAPRPNYWGALLWRQLMGTTVLDSGVPITAGLHVYAHCQRASSGGVTLLVINNDRNDSRTLTLPDASERYRLDAVTLQDVAVRLNGNVLSLDDGDQLPRLTGVRMAAGPITLKPVSISFLAIPEAGNSACR